MSVADAPGEISLLADGSSRRGRLGMAVDASSLGRRGGLHAGASSQLDGVRRSVAVGAEGLRRRYGETAAVDGVSFEVERGEIFGILGPNGSGKTTTVECLQGLRRADGGVLRVLGLDPQSQGVEVRRRIGCQLQESALPERIRVWEALDLFAALAPNAADWRRLVEDWGLDDKRDAFFHSLSGGQRQRLFVALALVNRPEVVFLDEMTTGLDPAARRVAWDLIATVREQGTTVVLVTHFMEEAERLCDRVAVLDHGRIVAAGTPAAVAEAHGGGTRVRFSGDSAELEWLQWVPHVREVHRNGGRVEVVGDGPVLPLVAAALVEHGIVPEDLRVEQPTLEDAFLNLIGVRE
jgi:ABC-2 type transport system ATP-binding protein